jgi:heat shock protein HslJ
MGDQGRQATSRFLPSGTVTGFGGCTNFKLIYTVDGDSLHFGQIPAGRPTCSAGTSLERDYLRALGRVRSWRITDIRLELLDAEGNTVLDFDRR